MDIPVSAQLADLPGADGVVSLREASIVANNSFPGADGSNVVDLDTTVFSSPATIVLDQGPIVFDWGTQLEGIDSDLTAIDLNQFQIWLKNGTSFENRISGFEIHNGSTAIRGWRMELEDVHLHSNQVGVDAAHVNVADSLFENNDLVFRYGEVNGVNLQAQGSTFAQNVRFVSAPSGNSHVDLVDSVFTENQRGIFATNLSLTRTLFNENGDGPRGNEIEFNDSTITNNGGGIWGAGTISGSEIANNAGGILSPDFLGALTISDTVFSGNQGGIESKWSDLTLERSAVIGNAAGITSWGGSIVDSTISDNLGGGVNLHYLIGGNLQSLVVQRSTISGNSGGGLVRSLDSPAVRLGNDTIEISSSIVAGNGGFDTSAVGPGPEMTFISSGYNLLGSHEGSAGSFTTHATDLLNQTDPGLAIAADNGGNTLTQALLLSSPALDGSVPGLGLTDQRGFPRFVDGDGDGTAQSDIGAFESDGSAPQFYLTDVSVDATTTVGQPLSLSANGVSANGPLTYTWEFSDGVTLSGANVTRAFTASDLQQQGFDFGRVELTVSDSAGNELNVTRVFEVVSDPPTATLVSAQLLPSHDVEVVMSYVDDFGIDPSTIDDSDLRISGPGVSQFLSLVSVTEQTLATGEIETLVTYQSQASNFSTGDYEIELQRDAVQDTQGNYSNDSDVILTTITLDIPTATATAADVNDSTMSDPVLITIVFADDVAIDGSTILNNGVVHVTPNVAGLPAIHATLTTLSNASSGTPIMATYEALPVGAIEWTSVNNADYDISVTGVTDTSGNTVQAGSIGSFSVAVTSIVDEPGSAVATATDLDTAGSYLHTINVAYSDPNEIDLTTLEADDIEVVRPDGTIVVPQLVFASNANPPQLTNASVQYSLGSPGGWTDADSGFYSIQLLANEVFDILGNPIPGGEIGSFVVDIPVTITNPLVPGGGLLPLDFSTSDLNHDVDLADLDGDGDLDAFLTLEGDGNQVYLNDGTGDFLQTPQSLEAGGASNESTIYAALGDVDGDGDIDALVTHGGAENELIVWENDGAGIFTLGGKYSTGSAIDVALADIDNDGDLDVYVAQASDPDLVFFNDGTGQLTNSGQAIGTGASKSVEFGDIDNDGDLDAVVGVQNGPNQIMTNDASGLFTVGSSFGTGTDQHVALGDLDGDGDLDAVASTSGVWLNNNGAFTLAGQMPGASNATSHVALADFDSDGDLDAYLANWSGNEDWIALNEGSGTFTGLVLSDSSNTTSSHVALGDLDGDGDLDGVVALYQNPGVTLSWINTLGVSSLACDYVGAVGCDMADIDALYDGSNGAPNTLTDGLIVNWLTQASSLANPLKSNSAITYVLGDVDLDGDVDSIDLGQLLNNFDDNTGLNWSGGNLNSDASVNSIDLGMLLNNFGYASAVAATSASVSPPTASATSILSEEVAGSDVTFFVPTIQSPQQMSSTGVSVRDLVFGQLGEDDES